MKPERLLSHAENVRAAVEQRAAATPRQRTAPPEEAPPQRACPETGGRCQHPDECNGPSVVDCWARYARRACEPEGVNTGLHRDSMG